MIDTCFIFQESVQIGAMSLAWGDIDEFKFSYGESASESLILSQKTQTLGQSQKVWIKRTRNKIVNVPSSL